MNKVIGIDLGTTNSCVSTLEGGKPKVIPNAEGARTTPSVVALDKKGQRLVGAAAKRQAISNPENTVSSIKRHMGDSSYKVKMGDKSFTPQEISSFILMKLKSDAEKYFGSPVNEAVITVPAYFNDSQRQATKDSAEIAGIKVLRIINEPTAASLAYGVDGDTKDKNVLVFDLGGGTFDVSLLEMSEGVTQVVATSGDNLLGGDDFDKKIEYYILSEFKSQTGVDLSNDKTAMQRVKDAAENAKKDLSQVFETNINLPFISADSSGPKHLDLNLSRTHFENLCKLLIERIRKPLLQVLEDGKSSVNDVNVVLLVGGSTRMPFVVKLVEDMFGKDKVNRTINPDEAVADGAAKQAGIVKGDCKDVLLLDVAPLSLGIETLGGVFTKIIEKNTTIPAKKSQVFSTAEDNQPAVTINAFQGERSMAKDNHHVGRFDLQGIPPARRGVPQIEVTFDIDSNGIMRISARDLGTGKSNEVVVNDSNNLSKEDIERMKREAEEHKEQDKKQEELVLLKNQVDQFIFTSENMLSENKDKFSNEDVQKLEEGLKKLKEVKNNDNIDEINNALKEVQTTSQKMASDLYKNNTEQQDATNQKNNTNQENTTNQEDATNQESS